MSTLYDELSRVTTYEYTREEVQEFELLHDEIRRLKKERNAVIVAHNYYRPEILKVADFVGDSLELALMAAEGARRRHHRILRRALHGRDREDRQSDQDRAAAESDGRLPARRLRAGRGSRGAHRGVEGPQYPDLAVVSYVNTTAAVKALSDIIVTSANAAKVVRTLPNKNILFVPDRNLAHHVAEQLPEKNIIPWDGYCYVHQQITPEEIAKIRAADPELEILVHPECRPDVAKLADAVLSTSGMVRYAKERPATRFLIVTECGLSDRLAMEVPDKTFLKGCKLCAFMKVTTLEDVRDSLLYMRYEIDVPEDIRVPAERALRRMFDVVAGNTF
jgi:quinolinate synthase